MPPTSAVMPLLTAACFLAACVPPVLQLRQSSDTTFAASGLALALCLLVLSVWRARFPVLNLAVAIGTFLGAGFLGRLLGIYGRVPVAGARLWIVVAVLLVLAAANRVGAHRPAPVSS